ncbi:prolyl oligopeptidase family protein [Actinomycetospora succinea]|uniref:Prolyl oligopeptidase family protein n=2 Tax=Actinomycetospora succinea TaxID=663603 RepID=A0A4R6VDX4_9PSEU|nr:prolyl oligopeptidase family protein [Actinomycetospora succinea]
MKPLFTDHAFDFSARTALGHAGMGVGDVGMVLEAIADTTDGDATSWYDAWHGRADELSRAADAARAAGRLGTAAHLYLASSAFHDESFAFVDGMEDTSLLLPAFRAHRAAWDAFVACSDGRHLPIDLASEGVAMPGYLFRPDASGAARATLVVTNGSDGALSGLWATAIRPALDRGWNAVVFDGPGQQSLLFERDIPFRHDWEAVLTPVVDTLVARPDVDARALVGYGISQGGYWLPRALAFEHRFAAAVVDGGVVDVARSWNRTIPAQLLDLLRAGDRDGFNTAIASGPADPVRARTFAFRAKPYGGDTPYDVFAAAQRFTLEGLTDRITTPLLITDPDDEDFFGGQSRELHDALPGTKEIVRFTAEQGANRHCEPMARGLVGAVMTDFLAAHLPA